MPSGETRQPDNRMTRGRKENKKTRSDNRQYASGRQHCRDTKRGKDGKEEGYNWVLGGFKEHERQKETEVNGIRRRI